MRLISTASAWEAESEFGAVRVPIAVFAYHRVMARATGTSTGLAQQKTKRRITVRRNHKSGADPIGWLTGRRSSALRIQVITASVSLAVCCASALAQLPVGFPNTVNLPVGVKVGLAAQDGVVWNTDLAAWSNPLMANQVEMTYAFGECFGGGMLDSLQANAAAANDDFSGTSASQWNQFAIYRGTAGKAADWVDTYTAGQAPAPGAPRHDTTAGDAWLNDPYGTAPLQLSWETAQYRENAAGGAITLTDMAVANRYAILWSGQPNNIDWDQLNTEYDLLTATYNYKPANIFVLAGTGLPGATAALPAGSALLTAPNLTNALINILHLDLTSLTNLDDEDQVLFWANDHGVIQGGNAPAVMVPRYGGPGTYSPPPTNALPDIYDMSDPSNWVVQAQWVPDEVAVPEPSTIALVVIGISVTMGCRKRRRSAS